VRFSRGELRDHINYRKNDRWLSYRFYRALQRLKSPMCYICEIFGARRFSRFSTQSARSGPSIGFTECTRGPTSGRERSWANGTGFFVEILTTGFPNRQSPY
jgi:hypothetical protein